MFYYKTETIEEQDSKLDGSCAAHAREWKELRRLSDEELAAIHDTNKLPNDSDSLELFRETLPSPSLMQLQGDKREVVRRALLRAGPFGRPCHPESAHTTRHTVERQMRFIFNKPEAYLVVSLSSAGEVTLWSVVFRSYFLKRSSGYRRQRSTR